MDKFALTGLKRNGNVDTVSFKKSTVKSLVIPLTFGLTLKNYTLTPLPHLCYD